MGFELKDTFDMLCGEGKDTCERGSEWKIEWGGKGQQWETPEKTKGGKSEL